MLPGFSEEFLFLVKEEAAPQDSDPWSSSGWPTILGESSVTDILKEQIIDVWCFFHHVCDTRNGLLVSRSGTVGWTERQVVAHDAKHWWVAIKGVGCSRHCWQLPPSGGSVRLSILQLYSGQNWEVVDTGWIERLVFTNSSGQTNVSGYGYEKQEELREQAPPLRIICSIKTLSLELRN